MYSHLFGPKQGSNVVPHAGAPASAQQRATLTLPNLVGASDAHTGGDNAV